MKSLVLLLCASSQGVDELRAVAESIAPGLIQYGAVVDLERLTYEVRTADQAVGDLVEQQAMFFTDEYWDASYVYLRAWGLQLPPREEYVEAVVHGFASSMRAYYHPPRSALVLLDNQVGDLDKALSGDDGLRGVLTHELVHAAQDQAKGIAQWLAPHRDLSESVRLQQCLIEGEADFLAALSMSAGAFAERDPDTPNSELSRLLTGPAAVTYEAGRQFLHRCWRTGGRAALDAALSEPPASTEQVLHAQKYPDDRPTPIEPPELPGVWYSTVLGELETYKLLASLGQDSEEAFFAASGWDGDRLVIARTEDGVDAVLWRTLWDRRRDALQFARLIESVFEGEVVRRGRVVDWLGGCDADGPHPFPASLRSIVDDSRESPPEVESDADSTKSVEAEHRARTDAKSRVVDGEWILDEAGIAVAIPEAWDVVNLNGVPMLMGQSPPSTFTPNVNLTLLEVPVGVSLDDVERLTLEQLESLGLEAGRRERRDVAGHAALYIEYAGLLPGAEHELKFVATVWVDGSRNVILTGTCSPEQWAESSELMISLVCDVRALEPAD